MAGTRQTEVKHDRIHLKHRGKDNVFFRFNCRKDHIRIRQYCFQFIPAMGRYPVLCQKRLGLADRPIEQHD